MSNIGCFGLQQTKSERTSSNHSSKSSSRDAMSMQKTQEPQSQSLKITHINKQNAGLVKLLKPSQGISTVNSINNINLLNSSNRNHHNRSNNSNDNKTNQNNTTLKNEPKFVISTYEAPRTEEKHIISSTDQKKDNSHDLSPHTCCYQTVSQHSNSSDNKLGCYNTTNHGNTQQSEFIKYENQSKQTCIPQFYDNFSWLNNIPLHCPKHPTQFIIHPVSQVSQQRQKYQQQQQPQTIIYINSISINTRSKSKDDSPNRKEIPISRDPLLTYQTADSLSTLQNQCHHKTDHSCGNSSLIIQRNQQRNLFTDSDNNNNTTKSMLSCNLRQSHNHQIIQPTYQPQSHPLIKTAQQGWYHQESFELNSQNNHQKLEEQHSNDKRLINSKQINGSLQSIQNSSKQYPYSQIAQPIRPIATGLNELACPLMPQNQNKIQQTLKISNTNHKKPNYTGNCKFNETCVNNLEAKDRLQCLHSIDNTIESQSNNTAQFIEIPDQFKVNQQNEFTHCDNENKPNCSPSFKDLSEQQSEQKNTNEKEIPKLSFLESSCSFACQEDSQDRKVDIPNPFENKMTYSIKNAKPNSLNLDSSIYSRIPNVLNYPKTINVSKVIDDQVNSGLQGVSQDKQKQQIQETINKCDNSNQKEYKDQITSWLITEIKHIQQNNEVETYLLGNNKLKSNQANQNTVKDQFIQPAQRMKPQLEEKPSKLFTKTSISQPTPGCQKHSQENN